MTLRPPPPDLHGRVPPGRLELRKADKNGISVGGTEHFSGELHHWAGRDVLVVGGHHGRVPILALDGKLTQAVTSDRLTGAFRDAFYAARQRQRTTIDAHRRDKLKRDLAARPPAPKRHADNEPVVPTTPRRRPVPLDSPLDALRPLGRLGWPFGELRDTASLPERSPDATPLR